MTLIKVALTSDASTAARMKGAGPRLGRTAQLPLGCRTPSGGGGLLLFFPQSFLTALPLQSQCQASRGLACALGTCLRCSPALPDCPGWLPPPPPGCAGPRAPECCPCFSRLSSRLTSPGQTRISSPAHPSYMRTFPASLHPLGQNWPRALELAVPRGLPSCPPLPLVSGQCLRRLRQICQRQAHGVVSSPGPAGGRGWWRLGGGRGGGKGQAPPCGAAHPRPSSQAGQPGGPGAPAPCCRSRTPRAGTGMSRAGLGDPASTLGSGKGGAHLLQKPGRGEGGDDSIGHGWADAVELLDLPPPGCPQPCATSCHLLSCCPAPCGAEGEGPRLPGLPGKGRVRGGP